MSNITIFEHKSNLPTVARQSRLSDKIRVGGGLRRLQLSNAQNFKRIVGGEQIGKAIPQEINVIIVDMMSDISREYYASAYDPDAQAALPDCWSNDGRTSDPKAPNRQSPTCAACKMNVEGSGQGGKKACRYKRRLAVIAEGDPSGDVYQLALASRSLFGKGTGTVHPFESYCTYLKTNGEGPDTVVTKVMYEEDSPTVQLKFKAIRHLTQEEADLVDAAFADPETQRYIQLTAAEADGVTAKPKAVEAPKPKNIFADGEEEEAEEVEAAAEEEEETPKPVKRVTAKKPAPPIEEEDDMVSLIDEWAED